MTSKRYAIYKFFQEMDEQHPGQAFTSNEIAEKLGFDRTQTRVYLNRLKKEGRIRVVDRFGRLNLYALNKDVFAQHSKYKEIIDLLRFLNDFFKENVGHLSKSKKIMEFIKENAEKFSRIEELVAGAREQEKIQEQGKEGVAAT